jgi:hypothetical protein
MLQSWEAYDSVPDYPADEDEDDDVFDWDGDTDYQPQDNFGAKQEAETVSHLPPEYQSVLAIDCDKEALLQQALDASKTEDEAAFPDLPYAMRLMRMVAKLLASLPPPPLLPVYAPPLAAYKGQEVPPPPDASPQHRQDHPHGVVINPPPQP